MKRCAIDTLYVYDSARFEELSVRVQPGEFRYRLGHELLKSNENEVTRYAQTFEIDGIKKTLFFNTLYPDKKKAAKFLKDSAQQIEKSPRLFESFRTATRRPVELSIKYS